MYVSNGRTTDVSNVFSSLKNGKVVRYCNSNTVNEGNLVVLERGKLFGVYGNPLVLMSDGYFVISDKKSTFYTTENLVTVFRELTKFGNKVYTEIDGERKRVVTCGPSGEFLFVQLSKETNHVSPLVVRETPYLFYIEEK